MVGSKSSGLCWADEVEKEEEEQIRTTLVHKSGKSNPFGSARPREVVLQEKGIDWRKLDLQLLHPTQREEKQLTENAPALREPVGGRKLQSPRIKGIEQNVEGTRSKCHESQIPLSSLTLQDENIDPLVPPLRYPPRNIMALMKGKQWPNDANRIESCLPKPVELHSEQRNEIRLHEPGTQRSRKMDANSRSPNCHSQSKQYDRDSVWDGENSVYENREPREIRNARSSSVNGEREWKNVNTNSTGNRFFEDRLMGPPQLGRGRRGSVDKDWKGEANGYGRMNGCGERRSWSPSITDLPNGGRYESYYLNKEHGTENLGYLYAGQRFDARDLEGGREANVDRGRAEYHERDFEGGRPVKVDQGRAEYLREMDMKKAGFGVNSRNVEPGQFEECGTKNMGYLNARQRFDSRDFEGEWAVKADRGRARDYQDMDIRQAEFGMNNNKRGMKYRPNTARDHQRRRQ